MIDTEIFRGLWDSPLGSSTVVHLFLFALRIMRATLYASNYQRGCVSQTRVCCLFIALSFQFPSFFCGQLINLMLAIQICNTGKHYIPHLLQIHTLLLSAQDFPPIEILSQSSPKKSLALIPSTCTTEDPCLSYHPSTTFLPDEQWMSHKHIFYCLFSSHITVFLVGMGESLGGNLSDCQV